MSDYKIGKYGPQESLNYLRAAFINLFEDKEPDLGRFLRLAIDVFDPAQYSGVCKGDGVLLPEGCGKKVYFKAVTRNGAPVGYGCPICGAVFLWSLCKGPKPAPRRVVLTSHGSTIGDTRSAADSGVTFTDRDDPREHDVPEPASYLQ